MPQPSPAKNPPSAALRIVALTAAALTLVACGGPSAPPAPPPSAGVAAAESGYEAPPQLSSATRQNGQLVLAGRAQSGAEVRLASPDGRLLTATAGADGAWTIMLPETRTPEMFAFSAIGGGRTVRAEGAVVTLPAPATPALLARAGFGVLGLGQGAGAPVILAVDHDQSGGAAVSGLAAPNASVRLSLDGMPAGLAQADARGRFAVLAANRTLEPGRRRIEVETEAGRAQVTVASTIAAPLSGAPFRASRMDGGWRIDWAPPGGGVQTTLVFDAAETPA